jgi:dihydrofolate reductase
VPPGGGVATVRQYLQEALIDEMHLVISPGCWGFSGIDAMRLGYRCTEHVARHE